MGRGARIALAGVGVITVAGAGWLAWRRFGRKQVEPYGPGGTEPAPLPLPEAGKGTGQDRPQFRPDSTFPLSIYMTGPRVLLIQKALNAKHKAGLDEDGDWGPLTQDALEGNGLPTVITEAQFKALAAYMGEAGKGLAGAYPTAGRQAVAARETTVWSERLQLTARIRAGTLLGTVVGGDAGLLEVLALGGDLLVVRESDAALS